jgi:hypothetical protein
MRRENLRSEIEHEKTRIRAKYLYRYALGEEDPFGLFK